MDIYWSLAYSRRAARTLPTTDVTGRVPNNPHTNREDTRMGKRLFLRLALAAVLPALATMTWVTGAAAVTTITTCGPLTKLGETYNLANDLTSCGTCLTVANNRITINLKNFFIIGECDGSPTLAGA